MSRTLLVSGAGGKLGRLTIEALIGSTSDKIVAGTRDPAKLADLAARGVEVRRIDFDAALQQDRFLLASAADPRALPSVVLAERPSAAREESPAVASDRPRDASDLESALRAARPANNSAIPAGGIPLVEPKKIAKLHVISGSMQMFLQVLPLEKGVLDETVRVKVAGSGQILRGRVIAPGQLEAQF